MRESLISALPVGANAVPAPVKSNAQPEFPKRLIDIGVATFIGFMRADIIYTLQAVYVVLVYAYEPPTAVPVIFAAVIFPSTPIALLRTTVVRTLVQ